MEVTLPQSEMLNPPKRINVFLAGQGSGKTFIMGLIAYYLITKYPNAVGFIAANTHKQLTQTTLRKIKEVWARLGVHEYRDGKGNYTDSVIPPKEWIGDHHNLSNRYNSSLVFSNQALVFHGSLENYKAHDGKEFAWALLDETKDTREDAIKEVILGRLRQGIIPNDPLYIFTSPAKVPWLNEMLQLEKWETQIREALFGEKGLIKIETETTRTVISTTFHNQANLPPTFIPNQIKLLGKSKTDMLVYGYPFAQEGGEFYHKFDMRQHVFQSLPYDPEKPLHLTYDFNVIPYLSIQAWQIHGQDLCLIAEVPATHPDNDTEAATKLMLDKFPNQKAMIVVYGDPSGKNRSTRGKRNDYAIILGTIKPKPCLARVARQAPPVSIRGQFLNNLFAEAVGNWRIKIDSKCIYSIRDFVNVKQSADSTKEKTKVSDSLGKSYEPFGHMSDAFDYFICEVISHEFKRYQKQGSNG